MTTLTLLMVQLGLGVGWWLKQRRATVVKRLGSIIQEPAVGRFLANRVACYTRAASAFDRSLARYVAAALRFVAQTEGFQHLVLAAVCHLRSRLRLKGGAQ